MKKKELKKIKKIIGVLSAIVQEHEGRRGRARWKNLSISLDKARDASSDQTAISIYERMVGGYALRYSSSFKKNKRLETKIIPFSADKKGSIND